ncbi:MAG: hypothetical protein WD824_12035 [Cyclobacteriaceae bacterium]
MIRKNFVFVSLFTVVLFSHSFADRKAPPYTKKELLAQLVVLNDMNIPTDLERQLTKKGTAYYGAVFDADSVVSPIATAQLIQFLMCAYVSRDSKYYQSKEILQRLTLAANALVNLQHEDGTIDLLTTNFHSTPDLGFTIFPLGLAYSIMLKNNQLDYGDFPLVMKKYLLKAGEALAAGGIHTPNHRWVVTAGLAWVNSFFPDPKYRTRVDQWLAEKIDIDPDGQYNERSTAVYTPITNRTLLDVAIKMKYDFLFDIVRRNLNLTFYFVHSNGEIVTESSNRQDKYLQRNMSGYYLAYNYMALMDKDSRYSGMVDYIQRTVPLDHLLYMLPHLIEDPALLRDLPEPKPLLTDYHKYFEYSNMVRIREGEVDMSIITNNPTFLTFFKGEAALEAVRLSAAFFGKGQFESQQLQRDGDTYILSSTMQGPYYQPLTKEALPVDAEAWGQLPRSEREQSEIQTLQTKIYITQAGGKAKIKVVVDGPKNLPVVVEFGFRMGGILKNVKQKQGIDNAYLIRNGGYVIYEKGKHSIKIGPGTGAHKWTQLRGALPKLQADCVYFTNYAPCEFEFAIE